MFENEINRRKTFGIISHPDAGKTTLTEKLLLYGGAIQSAGAVKSNKIKKTAASDFMEIERQRGISVATSVMTFEYEGRLINLLDTPGHKDFAEDTYRTLSAVDSVILVIDSVKGVEEQTKKLTEVCRMRDTPIIVFINKLDLEGRDPFELMDELELLLKMQLRPMSWPINRGKQFKGVYDLRRSELNLFESAKTKVATDVVTIRDLNDPKLDEMVGKADAEQLRSDCELVNGVYGDFDRNEYLSGRMAPLFFGSAVNNFGVKELLDSFVELAPTPQPRPSSAGTIVPTDAAFSGFVFKIHANLDPNHRDRIAFLRVCSGRFERSKFYQHTRLGKPLRFNNPYSFLARDKNLIEEAFPGDVIGLYDTGSFKIGDTLSDRGDFNFQGVPSFSPEIFKEVVNTDPLKSKQLDKGVEQLTDEGVAQLFVLPFGSKKIIGTVGELQFEVIRHRLQHEYGAACNLVPRNYYKACWITTGNEVKLAEFIRIKQQEVAYDKEGNAVFLAPSAWMLQMAEQNYPELTFHQNSEFKTSAQG